MRRFAGPRRLAAIGCGLLAGCASFNMSPPCEETGIGLMRRLAISDISKTPDDARLSSLMTVANLREIEAHYNARTCGASVSAFGRTVDVVYHIEQSQGVRNWYEIEVLNLDDAAVGQFAQELRTAYAH